MATTGAARRNALKASTFGLPEERKYPLDTRGRAANAKARASQQEATGNLPPSQKATIDRKADRVLGEHRFAHNRPLA